MTRPRSLLGPLALVIGLVACTPTGASGAPVATDQATEPDPAAVATTWVDALSGGDTDAAWMLLSEEARQAVGGREGFEALGSALAEGWGAWAAADYRVRTIALADGRAGSGAVVLEGTRSAEGMTETTAAALPYVGTHDGVRLEPFVGTVDWQVPDRDAAAVPASTPLAAYLPFAEEVVFALDDRLVDADIQGADGDQVLASVVAGPLEPGEHVVTVIASTAGGLVADARLFAVK